LIPQHARDPCDAYGATVYEFDGTLIHYHTATGVSDDAITFAEQAALARSPALRLIDC